MLPSEYPEVRDYPNLRTLLGRQVDMQFADLRALLRLPERACDLKAGCNLTTVTLLCNIAAGASVLFWNSSFEALTERGNRGERFKALMEEHYPWHSDDAATGRAGAEAIWDFTRSPLTHTLGVGKDMATFPGPATRSR